MAVPNSVRWSAWRAASSDTLRRRFTLLAICPAVVAETVLCGWAAFRAPVSAISSPIILRPPPCSLRWQSFCKCAVGCIALRRPAAQHGFTVQQGLTVRHGFAGRAELRLLLVAGCAAYSLGLMVRAREGYFARRTRLFCCAQFDHIAAIGGRTANARRLGVVSLRPSRRGASAWRSTTFYSLGSWPKRALRGVDLLGRTEILSGASASDAVALAAQVPGAAASRPGVLRVAIVEGLTAAGPRATSTCGAELDRPTDGLTICHGSLAEGDEPNAWRQRLTEFRPDVVLGLVAVLEQGLKLPAVELDPFDWRSLETLRLVAGLFAEPAESLAENNCAARSTEATSAASETRRLTICRTPLDDSAKSQWRETFAQLNALVEGCACRSSAPGTGRCS